MSYMEQVHTGVKGLVTDQSGIGQVHCLVKGTFTDLQGIIDVVGGVKAPVTGPINGHEIAPTSRVKEKEVIGRVKELLMRNRVHFQTQETSNA